MRFSRIDDKLSVYINKRIVIFGASSAGKEIKNFLDSYDFTIVAFCDNDYEKWETDFLGLKVISPIQLKEMMDDNVLVQIASCYEMNITGSHSRRLVFQRNILIGVTRGII